jgi:cyclic pyranopterin monophosphate synthase
MKDVTFRPETLREATAEARVCVDDATRRLIADRGVSKGDVLEASRIAAMMAVKKTPDILPFCHPLPVGGIDARAVLDDRGVLVTVTVRGIANTGFEMEALAGASVGALNVYDMLKPHSDDIAIEGARLLGKRGGTGDWRERLDPPVRAAVLVLSDSVASGSKADKAGLSVRERLERTGCVDVAVYEILPDEPEALRERVRALVADGVELVATVGGTGLWRRDRTIEALEPLLEMEIPGIMEAARAYGQRRTPRAMLSRGICGLVGSTLVITLPGSSRGALESCDALLPALLHAFRMIRDPRHSPSESAYTGRG